MPQQKTYGRSKVLQACLHYFAHDVLAANTWMNKYALKNDKGQFLELTPYDMHRRMARELARVEDAYQKKNAVIAGDTRLSSYGQTRLPLSEERIFSYFKNFRYLIPQGSVMASLGKPNHFCSLSNCVVLPPIYDSYGGILFTDQQLAQLFKRRCGVGIDLSTLRPAGAKVQNAATTTIGAVSFMSRFNHTTHEVAQLGRRGALMMTMDVAHPDIEAFIYAKQNLSQLTEANISVKISDDFMRAVQNDTDFTLRFPIDSSKPLFQRKIKAKHLWEQLLTCAHQSAEPGLLFWDKQHRYSTSSLYPNHRNVAVNPCGEIAMQGGDSCRLMALNLFELVQNPFTAEASFDFNQCYALVYEAMRLLDDLVDLELDAITRILQKINNDPEPDEIKMTERITWEQLYQSGKSGRRTGLGFTALADALAALNLSYGSDEALQMTEKIMRCKCRAEFDSSIDMAIERGSFADFDIQMEAKSDFVGMLQSEFPDVYARMMLYGRRNISLSTVAPTGTLSILTQTSAGVEPVYALSYTRKTTNNNEVRTYEVVHPKLKYWQHINPHKNAAESPYHGNTALEIPWQFRIKMQALIQKYVTHSISSTVNLPANTSVALVGEILMLAWKTGLKGITIYREGTGQGYYKELALQVICRKIVDQ